MDLEKYGITSHVSTHYEWNGCRYTNAYDALRAAQRVQAAATAKVEAQLNHLKLWEPPPCLVEEGGRTASINGESRCRPARPQATRS